MDSSGNLPGHGTPPAEIALDAAVVSALLAEQYPDLATLPLRVVDAGWDNALFRLGDALAVRLPRRAAAAALVVHEQTWLPRLAPQLPLPVPVPVRIGMPTHNYPWRWSVVPWLGGLTADRQEPGAAQARPLAAFLRALHVPAPLEAPANPFRGVPLGQRAAAIDDRLQRLAGTTSVITPSLRRIWADALDAPLDVPSTWLHGDLHPRNVLVERGIISGILDWGDLTAGDRATDLAAIWMLFGAPRARADALASYGPLSEATLRRAKGWAIVFGTLLLESGLVDHPQHAAIGARTLARVDTGP